MMSEIFPIPGMETRYGITKDGQVWSFPKLCLGKCKDKNIFTKGKWLKISIRDGYYVASLNRKRQFVHRLLAFTFIPAIPDKNCINHKNGIKTDNCLNNLEWVTNSENMIHAWKSGLTRHVPKKKKLTQQQLDKIKILLSKKIYKSEIIKKFNISYPTLYKIIRGDYYV